jgi:hypothetical protein
MVRPKGAGGPRTPKGKEASAKNSLKHGSYSVVAVLPNENQDDFDQLLAHVTHDLKPIDFVETALVRDLVVITWKKLRLEKLEHAYFMKKLNEPITQDEFKSCDLLISDGCYQFGQRKMSHLKADQRNLASWLKRLNPIFIKRYHPNYCNAYQKSILF